MSRRDKGRLLWAHSHPFVPDAVEIQSYMYLKSRINLVSPDGIEPSTL